MCRHLTLYHLYFYGLGVPRSLVPADYDMAIFAPREKVGLPAFTFVDFGSAAGEEVVLPSRARLCAVNRRKPHAAIADTLQASALVAPAVVKMLQRIGEGSLDGAGAEDKACMHAVLRLLCDAHSRLQWQQKRQADGWAIRDGIRLGDP